MANSRIIVNLSPSFIKVMPFECKGKNELILTSYTNSFEQVKKGLVCIFRAEETNDGAVKIKLSNVEKEIKLLTQDKKDLFPGTLKAGDFYEASFDGVDLILHEKQLNVSAGNNINIQKSKDGKLVISADNTDTWRPIGDSLDSAEKDKSASLYALNILYKKYQAIEKIISETKSTVIGYDTKIIAINKNIENVLNEITMLKKALESSDEKIKTVENKNQALEGEITGTKKELVELTKHVAEVGNNNFVKVQRNGHGFITGDVLTLSGNVWNLTKQNETGVAICVMIDVNNFLAIYSGIREYQGDIKDSLGKTIIENTIYYCSGTPGKCTSTKPLETSQKAFFAFGNGGRKYIKNILNGITDKPEKRIDTSNLVTKKELENATKVYDDGSRVNIYTEPSKQYYPDSDLAREGASKIRIPRDKYYRACNYMGGFLKFEISIFRGPGDAVAIVNGYVGVDQKYNKHKLIVTDSMFLDNDVDLFIGLSHQGGTKGEHYSLWFKYTERDNYMEISNFKCKFEAVKTTGRITTLEDNYDHFKLDMLEDPRGKDDPFGFPPIPKNVFSVNGVPVGALTRDEVGEMLSGLGSSLDKKIENKADKNHGTHLPVVTVNDKGKYLKGDLTWGDITLQGLGGLSKVEIQKMIPIIPPIPTAQSLGVVSKTEIQKMLPTAQGLGVITKEEILKLIPKIPAMPTAATLGVISKAEIQKMIPPMPTAGSLGVVPKSEILKLIPKIPIIPTAASLGVVPRAEIQKMMPNMAGYMKDGGTYGTIKLNNWIRTLGQSGWYSETYGGGVYMIDTTWVRIYNDKALYVNNQISATNNVTAYYSDTRLKKNFKKIDSALKKIMSVNPYFYQQNAFAEKLGYKHNDEIQIGFKAQEMQKILPQVVKRAPINMEVEADPVKKALVGDNEILTLDYAKIVPLLWKGMQEQQEMIDKLIQKKGR